MILLKDHISLLNTCSFFKTNKFFVTDKFPETLKSSEVISAYKMCCETDVLSNKNFSLPVLSKVT